MGKHNLGCRNKIYLTDTQLNTNLDVIKSIFLKKNYNEYFFYKKLKFFCPVSAELYNDFGMTNLRGKELHLERGASKSRTMTGRWVYHFDLVVVGVADV